MHVAKKVAAQLMNNHLLLNYIKLSYILNAKT